MKMNLDDPNLTAYALGELPEADRAAMENAIAESPEAQAFVRQTQQFSRVLRSDFRFELERAARKPVNIMPLPAPRSFWSDARWMSIGVAALLAIAAVLTAIALSPIRSRDRTAGWPTLPADVQMEFETELEPPLDSPAARTAENPFVSTASNPVSALSFNVGRESYQNVRRNLADGKKPPRELVRLEGLINYFPYDYPTPKSPETFALDLAAAACPWQSEHRLVRVAVKARAPAQRVQLSVNFDPARVESYRLLGYEDRPPRDLTSPPEGANESRVQAGQTLTALYEIQPAAKESFSAQLLSVTLIYYPSDGSTKFVMQNSTVEDYGNDFENAPADFRFAAAVAEFGMILRDSPHKGNGTLAAVLEWSNESKGHDETGDRAGFIELIRQAQAL